ncbi:Fc receptor-like protein 3 isoform X3 [Pseudophryne corroboree]|uniref:Fc receptor-like protein 3 isoform X3 n=1 Tax=Pseudophryne corroboree TaxID=495146 RepID=UPI0030815DBD
MTGLFLFVLISSFMDHSKAAVKPWVTLDPDWKKIFRGSSVTLTCNSKYTGWEIQDYKWYKDNEPMYVNQRTLTIDSAKMRDNGNYQCETTDSERSDHVRLDVSDGLLILQAPVAVYEGDTLTMQCLGRNKYFEKDSSFYKYEKRLSSTGSVLRLQNVNSKMSGQYKCTRERATILSYKKEDAWTSLSVSDLFSVPVIKLVQSPVKEGGDMTLSCDTALAPPRQDTGLRFAFYRDERTVQDFSVSTIYSVLSTQLGHSGYYTCDVRTPSGGVMKRSNMLYIHIHELFKSPELQISPSQMVLEGEDVSLQCVTTSNTGARLLYTFYRDSQAVQGATADSRYLIPQAGQEHSGDYMCSVQSTDERVMKTSTDGNLLVQKLFNSPELQISPSQMVLEGEDIRLQCVTTSNTGARLLYTFYRDSQAIQGATADSSYIITQAGEENTGDYKCSVQSMGGNIQRNSTDLHILVQTGTDQPQIELRPEMVLLGGEVVLLCESRNGSLPIHYRFYHDGTLIGNRTVHEKKAAELTLTNSSLTMAGPYYCDSGNEVSSQTQLSNIISLHVMDPEADSHITMTEEEWIIVWPVLGTVMLVLLLTFVLLFIYQQKVAALFTRCGQHQPNTDKTFVKSRDRVGETQSNEDTHRSESISMDQGEYSNIPARGRDVSYVYIDINRLQEASSAPTEGNGEYSVTYTTVKPLGTRHPQETPDPSDIYQNFTAKDH